MLKRIKDINEALPGMLLIECIYLVVAQIIIFIAVPNKIMCAVGLLAGCLYAVFSSFHLSFTIRKVVYSVLIMKLESPATIVVKLSLPTYSLSFSIIFLSV